MINNETGKPICLFCGKDIERYKNKKGYEKYERYMKRKFCNPQCMGKYKTLNPPNKGHQENRVAHATARKINETFLHRDKCEICGSSLNLDVHHIDGDFTNNSFDNLQVLCRSCHSKQHKSKTICSVEGCSNPIKGHGYCNKHYIRFKKYGDPMVVRWNTKHTKYNFDSIPYPTTKLNLSEE